MGNNLLFKDNTLEGAEMEVMIVDWQLSYVGRSTGDLSYLLLSSISPKVRHEHELVFKEDYYNSFNSYLKTFEASVMNKLSQNTCGISFNIVCDDDNDNNDASNTPDLSDDERDEREQATVSFAYS